MAYKVFISAILFCSSMFLSGCIVQEIRDELKAANAQLSGVQEKLEQLEITNSTLDATNLELANTNRLIQNVRGGLTDIDTGLNRIDSTNDSLSMLEKQLVTLDSMNKSMIRLDGHLGSLRTTISKLDTALPFFDLGGTGETIDTPPPQLAPEDTQPAEIAAQDTDTADGIAAAPGTSPSTANSPAAPPTASAPATSPSASPARPDSMMGTWLSAYPHQGAALVILPTNKYHLGLPHGQDVKILGSVGQDNPKRIETGTWKREDRTIIFTPDAFTVSGNDNTTQTITPTPWKLTVLSQLARSSTTQIDDLLVVWNRP